MKPFGLEPQRVLRLEKMHVIIGQDTNAESQPLEAAMPWIVKLDKENDWIGRYSIEWYQRRGDRFALVGFEGQNGSVPKEGAQIIGAGGMPVGRVTSSQVLAPAREVDRDRVGAGLELRGRDADRDLGSLRARRSRRASAAAPSTTRTERCSGHERRRPVRLHVSRDRRDGRRAANADGAPPHRGGRGDREARRLADRRLPRRRRGGDPWIVDVSHFGKLDLRATASGLDQLTGGLAPGEARADGERLDAATDADARVHPLPLRQPRGDPGRDRRRRDRPHLRPGRHRDRRERQWRDVMNRSSGLDVRPPGSRRAAAWPAR